MSGRGEGAIFKVRSGAEFTPMELLEAIAKPGSTWTIDADDPLAFLRYVERVPMAIVRSHEDKTACNLSWVQGVGCCHQYGSPHDAPPVFADAIETVVQLGKLSRRVGSDFRSDGALVATSVQVGFLLAMLHTRNHEYFAYLGRINDKNLASNRVGTPITAEAKRLFRGGATVRTVAAKCGVGYQIARRWKIILENP